MGYFIPPIVFNVKQKIIKIGGRKTIDHKRVCVDGKQRLTSVQKFMNGHIGFYDGNRPSKKWYARFEGPMLDLIADPLGTTAIRRSTVLRPSAVITSSRAQSKHSLEANPSAAMSMTS